MKSHLLVAVGVCASFLGLLSTANAALVSRLGGQAVYDTDRDITWLADANLAASNTFGVAGIGGLGFIDGAMNWDTANSWITAMNADGGEGYLGFNDWRLPTTLVPDTGCTDLSGSPRLNSEGWGCTGSEMGHLFYDEFKATQGFPVLAFSDPVELAKFTNLQSFNYWSGTEIDSLTAWRFGFTDGAQLVSGKGSSLLAWAVRPGDVSAVPVPAAVWLFGSGLIGLLGIAKRKH